MKSPYVDRLCLGTAQFGSDYGIANRSGRVPDKEIDNILTYAADHGVSMLDTAYSYGPCEESIGKFMSKHGKRFDIVSKTPKFSDKRIEGLEGYLRETLERLQEKHIYGYLVHDIGDLESHTSELWDKMESLRQRGAVKKIGVSLYRPEELEHLRDNGINVDIIQAPYNILDRRFEDNFKALKSRNIDIYARSVYLQGLFFLEKVKLDRYFAVAQKSLRRLHEISEGHSIPLYALCLCFVIQNPLIDKVVIGVDSLEQLRQNFEALTYMDKVQGLRGELEILSISDEEVLLPFKWKI